MNQPKVPGYITALATILIWGTIIISSFSKYTSMNSAMLFLTSTIKILLDITHPSLSKPVPLSMIISRKNQYVMLTYNLYCVDIFL